MSAYETITDETLIKVLIGFLFGLCLYVIIRIFRVYDDIRLLDIALERDYRRFQLNRGPDAFVRGPDIHKNCKGGIPMGKIILKNAVERKEGFLYYVDGEGNVCEAKMSRGGSKGRKKK